MGQIVLSKRPTEIIGIHNDKVIDDFGTHDVYVISSLQWINFDTNNWRIIVTDENNKNFSYIFQPLEEGSWNIPTPQRFDSYPILFNAIFEGV